jgi:hypothetical protein
LAQRAYRQRKETTISSLRSRVDRLEDALNEVQSTFFELYTAAMATYVSKGERQTAWLKDLGARVSNLTRSALSGAEGETQEDTADEQHPDRDGSPRNNNSNNNNELSLGGHQWTPHSLFADAPQNNSTTQGIYESVPHTNFANHSIEIYPSLQHQPTIPLPSGPEQFMYYYQETKFSRRLQRAVFEHSYWLLTNSAAPQSEIARRFAFTFCYATIDDVLKSLTIILKGPPNERSLYPKDYPELANIPPRSLNCYDDILNAYHDKARLETIEVVNPSIRSEAYKQLIKLGINSEFLGPEEVELLLVDTGILSTIDSAVPGSPTHTEEMSTDNNSVDSFFPTPHLTPSASEHNGTQSSTMQAEKKLVDLDLLVRGAALVISLFKFQQANENASSTCEARCVSRTACRIQAARRRRSYRHRVSKAPDKRITLLRFGVSNWHVLLVFTRACGHCFIIIILLLFLSFGVKIFFFFFCFFLLGLGGGFRCSVWFAWGAGLCFVVNRLCS